MRRLSDVIKDIECHKCKAKNLESIHAVVKGNSVTASVVCKSCVAKDVIRVNLTFNELEESEETA